MSPGLSVKRAVGFGPTTSTLATWLPTETKCNETQEVTNPADPARSASAAQNAEIAPEPAPDADLAKVIQAWPKLPEAVKAGVLAMVKAAGGTD